MEVALSVSLSLLVFGGVVLTVYLVGTLSQHGENDKS